MVDIEYCPACGSPPKYAEVLGTLLHCRCRNCGCDYSTNVPPLEDDEEEFEDDD